MNRIINMKRIIPLAIALFASAVYADPVPTGLVNLATDSTAVSTSDSSTQHADYPYSYAFDGRLDNRMLAKVNDFDMIYTFAEPMAVDAYALTSVSAAFTGYGKDRDPQAWTFEGSNDGETWTTLDTQALNRLETSPQSTWKDNETKFFRFDNETPYLKYRLHVTNNFLNGAVDQYGVSYTQFAEVAFYFVGLDLQPNHCAKRLTMTCAGVPAGVELTDFPVLVRLSEDLEGFSYADIRTERLTDILFTDATGERLSHEIETWNPAGESFIWVKLPRLAKDATFTMYYGRANALAANDSTDVWSAYAAVWHFNNDAQGKPLPDSGPLQLKAAYNQNAKATTEGLVGSGFTNGRATVLAPTARLTNLSKSTYSGWIKATTNNATARLISGKAAYGNKGMELIYVDQSKIYLRGDGSSSTVTWTASSRDAAFPKAWTHYAGVCDGTTGTIYVDGSAKTSGTITQVTNFSDNNIGFGGCAGGTTDNLVSGSLDELRIYNGAASAAWIAQEYASIAQSDYLTYAPAKAQSATAPTFGNPVLTRTAAGDFVVTAELVSGEGSAYAVIATASDGSTARTELMVAAGDYPRSCTATLTGLKSDLTYTYALCGEQDGDDPVMMKGSESFYTGALTITKTSDANEEGSVPGVFTITRADAGAALPVVYSVGGTAEAGVVYTALAGTVTIPTGAMSVTVEVTPLVTAVVRVDTTVTLTLNDGLYTLPTMASATLTVLDLPFPEDKNVWIATARAKASEDANWSLGRAPIATDHVLFDGRYSLAFCDWDKAATHEVAAWTQAASYGESIVIVPTTYPEFDTAFTNLIVTGDMILDGGVVKQETHDSSSERKYRLQLTVGGDFRLASGTQLSAYNRGRRTDYSNWRAAAPHGGEINKTDSKGNVVPGYDSIFAPIENGWGSCDGTGTGRVGNGGGAIFVTVGGTFENNSLVTANSGNAEAAGGAGGAILIRARTIIGTGRYEAKGEKGYKSDGCSASGAGGRIALIATGENLADRAKIDCSGSIEGWGAAGGAGTIYMLGSNIERLLVKNANAEKNTTVTVIPSPDDVYDAALWRNLAVSVERRGHLQLGRDVKAASLTLDAATATVDLKGSVLAVKSVTVAGEDLKLAPGDYTLADAEQKGWTWLTDSSEGKTGCLRIYGAGICIIVR